MRVVATRIEQDGTMQRRVVDTARCSDGPEWEDLARRALAVPPPYRPVPGAPIYQVNLDGDREVLVAEHDLRGPLLEPVRRYRVTSCSSGRGDATGLGQGSPGSGDAADDILSRS